LSTVIGLASSSSSSSSSSSFEYGTTIAVIICLFSGSCLYRPMLVSVVATYLCY
jgi:hypothetical protein